MRRLFCYLDEEEDVVVGGEEAEPGDDFADLLQESLPADIDHIRCAAHTLQECNLVYSHLIENFEKILIQVCLKFKVLNEASSTLLKNLNYKKNAE